MSPGQISDRDQLLPPSLINSNHNVERRFVFHVALLVFREVALTTVLSLAPISPLIVLPVSILLSSSYSSPTLLATFTPCCIPTRSPLACAHYTPLLYVALPPRLDDEHHRCFFSFIRADEFSTSSGDLIYHPLPATLLLIYTIDRLLIINLVLSAYQRFRN